MFKTLNIFSLMIMTYSSKESGKLMENVNALAPFQELIHYNHSYQEFLCLTLIGKLPIIQMILSTVSEKGSERSLKFFFIFN